MLNPLRQIRVPDPQKPKEHALDLALANDLRRLLGIEAAIGEEQGGRAFKERAVDRDDIVWGPALFGVHCGNVSDDVDVADLELEGLGDEVGEGVCGFFEGHSGTMKL